MYWSFLLELAIMAISTWIIGLLKERTQSILLHPKVELQPKFLLSLSH